MRTVAVVNLKGGSGKSTLAVQLALHWSASIKTALADIDPQGSAALVLDRAGPQLDVTRSTGPKLITLKTSLDRRSFARFVIDTPGSLKTDTAAAISAADLALMVVRPTYLDLAAAAATSQLVRQLQTRALVVLNQAPPARGDQENPQVQKAIEALAMLRLPVARTIMRSRIAYGRATELGKHVAELEPTSPAAREFIVLTDEIERAVQG